MDQLQFCSDTQHSVPCKITNNALTVRAIVVFESNADNFRVIGVDLYH